MEKPQVTAWIAAYERAWRAPGTERLAELFTADASYSMGLYQEPAVGLPTIAALWEAERKGPDEVFRLTSEVVAVDGDAAVVRAGAVPGALGEDPGRSHGDHETILAGGRPVGNIGCFGPAGEQEVGYWIGREHWGRGLATSALAAFLGEETVRPLYAHVVKHNVGSIRAWRSVDLRW
jgi:RimJ/RimL family protein N-acetyltransferase